jgi:biopolymer transport protein ExbD
MNIRPRRRTTPPIPIVALVDILVITLLFIVATTSFRKRQTHLQISVPQSKILGQTTTSKETRLTLSITKDKKIFVDGHEVSEDGLTEALKGLKESKPQAKLEMNADQDMPLGLLVKVWDALKAAGYSINDVPARIQRAAAASNASGTK